MQIDVRYAPSFAALFVTLMPGDTITAEAGAMVSMRGVQMKTRFAGGFFKAIFRRLLGGESMFINDFTVASGAQTAELVLTQPTPGAVQRLDLNGTRIFLQKGSYIASEPGVKISLRWAGFASLIGGEGLFRLEASGNGAVFFGGYGAVEARELNGELLVDTGHLLAYEPTVSLKIAMSGGIFSSIFGGEGLVSRVGGHGRIYLQTRSVEGLASWANGQFL